MRERGPSRPHVAHHVELPVGVPLGVLDLLEPRLSRQPDVVDEHVEPTERAHRLLDHPTGFLDLAQIGSDVQRLPDARCNAAAAGHDVRAFHGEHPRGGKTDPGCRAGDEARLPAQTEIQGWLA